MSIYSERLAKLKKEIAIIESKKNTNFKKHQKEMIKFIHGRIDKVEFEVNSKTIILEMGDEKKGFRHILEKHFNPNDLETMDILNLPIIFKNALQLSQIGISNNALSVYKMLKNQKDLRLVTDETKTDKLVVTSYRKN
ncbi:hypothetical protein [Arcobacter sp. L]|uniref:hypothetical protein n=1 Tax=Arcobacter sp. L TaxID=944547 RepID=UPI00022964F5|nr:hypothetical protein [Arcobacter sp. L]BAK73210.1 hypothetical protein ABLL_1335 [Arcobacter sp. L]